MKPTNQQMKELVDFMGRHPALAKDELDDAEAENLWEVITVVLNNCGVKKPSKAWRKVIIILFIISN